MTEKRFYIGLAAGCAVVVAGLIWLFVHLEHESDKAIAAIEDKWAGATVVKVCRNGTRIYRLASGIYEVGAWGDVTTNPDTVCQP